MTMRVYSEDNLTPEPWTAAALCQQTDPDLFFPAPGDKATAAAAKRICTACPVRTECLEYAIRTRQPHGIWAGIGPKHRQRLRRTT